MDDETIIPEVVEIAELLKLLPHRYPFLMVDRVTNLRGDEFGIGIKNVTINEPHLLGHFPGDPVFPGVLLLEGMAQATQCFQACCCSRAWRRPPACCASSRCRRPASHSSSIS